MRKNVVVVGASRGIGKEISYILGKQHNVLAIARNLEKLKELQALATDNKIAIAEFDLSLPKAKENLGIIFSKHFSKIDILINCAGALVNKPILETTEDDLNHVFQTNVLGLIASCQAAIPFMSAKAHIVNIGSMGGFQGSVKFPGLAAYSASKSAVAGFSECLATELMDAKIQVNCLAIGAAQTEMLEEAFPGYEAPLNATEMATFIADFALHANQYINGKTVPVSISTP